MDPETRRPTSEAAQRVLEEIGEDIKQQIFVRALTRARAFGQPLSVVDVVRASQEVLRTEFRRPQAERLFLLYIVAGIAVAIAGLAALVLLTSGGADRPLEIAAGVVSAVGAFLASFAAALTVFRAQRRTTRRRFDDPYASAEDPLVLTTTFLLKWTEIEIAAREAVARSIGESKASVPLSRLIDQLRYSDLLDDSDADALRRLLVRRNQVTHEGVQVEGAEARELVEQADAVLSKLNSAPPHARSRIG